MNREQPLGLPPGSVRAVLAIILTGASVAAAFVGAPGSEFLWGSTSVVIGRYFAKRDPA